MDLRRLRYFVRIVDCGSLTKAAATLGVAQPALSQQLATLETEMSALLVERSSSGVAATAAGRRLYRHAQAILRQVDLMRDDVGSDEGAVAGTVAIGLPPSLTERFALPLLIDAARSHPDLHLIVEEFGPTSDIQLANGRVDIAVTTRPIETAQIVCERLFDEEFLLASLPGAFDLPPVVTLARAAQCPWIMPPAGHSVRTAIDAAFESAGLLPRIVADIDSKRTAFLAVRSAVGVALLTRDTIGEAPIGERVRLSRIERTSVTRPIFLCHNRRASPDPAVEYALDRIRAHCPEPASAAPDDDPNARRLSR